MGEFDEWILTAAKIGSGGEAEKEKIAFAGLNTAFSLNYGLKVEAELQRTPISSV